MVMPMRLKTPRSARLHCAAIKSLVPGRGRSTAGPPEAAPVRLWGDEAISQASLLAQALHEVFINGLRNSAVQHEISLRREASPLDGRGANKKGQCFCGQAKPTKGRSECASRSGGKNRCCWVAAPSRKSAGPGFRSVCGGIGLPRSTPGLHSFLMAPLRPCGCGHRSVRPVAANSTVISISAVYLYSSLNFACTGRQQTSVPCVAWLHCVFEGKEKTHRR